MLNIFQTPKRPDGEESSTRRCRDCVHWGEADNPEIERIEGEFSRMFGGSKWKRCPVWGTFQLENGEVCTEFKER
ncbi:MAG: hypothetical protein ACXQS4_02540 [Methermicoccaceae archaeon]